MRFDDRADAGQRLGEALRAFQFVDPIVLGLPRGGIPVAFEVAVALEAPLDALFVRKLGVPSQPELAFGAIGEDAVRVLNPNVVWSAGLRDDVIASIEAVEREELERRAATVRRTIPKLLLKARCVVIVDDGLATGATARAACQVARHEGAIEVVLAVPVAPRGSSDEFEGIADQFFALESPRRFGAVGSWYADFAPTNDSGVVELLARARAS